MITKTVIIGGGSVNWTPKLAQYLFLRDGLAGSELHLVDTASVAPARRSTCWQKSRPRPTTRS